MAARSSFTKAGHARCWNSVPLPVKAMRQAVCCQNPTAACRRAGPAERCGHRGGGPGAGLAVGHACAAAVRGRRGLRAVLPVHGCALLSAFMQQSSRHMTRVACAVGATHNAAGQKVSSSTLACLQCVWTSITLPKCVTGAGAVMQLSETWSVMLWMSPGKGADGAAAGPGL